MTLSEELSWRGFTNQTTYKDVSALDGKPVTFYWGVDPSSDSMTIGNLAAAMMVKVFMKHGHKAVLLVGGATGLIGDPDGKSEERGLADPEEIAVNAKAITAQYRRVFQGQKFKVVDNKDWFGGMRYIDFLREVGKHVPMRQMLARDFIRTRLGGHGSGISYAEFSYVLIQAYDFLRLHEDKGVTLQVCGSDQWGNSIAGVDLIRRKTGKEVHVYSAPLVVNKATGRKFGKTEEGAVWLDPSKTTPTSFYQFWVNVDDVGVEDYLKIYTGLSKAEVASVLDEQRKDPQQR
ncbi:MAG TPA: tyrosine--tRNA ligase, partial [Candidatus Saccharimonadales bacterium]|nr:tyrosine--tRNA ligase [Candidatus Saccharimonadales bacterium]